jgi:hypothetical protein
MIGEFCKASQMKKGEAREEGTMHVMTQEPLEREAAWMQANRKENVPCLS